MLGTLLKPEIQEMLEKRELRELKEVLADIPSPDVAEMLNDFGPDERGVAFRLLSGPAAIEVFEELSIDSQVEVMKSLPNDRLRLLLEEMAPDDRTSLFEDLPSSLVQKAMNMLSPDERKLATRLLGYKEGSAGRLMTPDLVWLHEDATASQALEKIRMFGRNAEQIHNCYVVSLDRILVGDVLLSEIVLAQPDRPIREIMHAEPVAATVSMDREDAATICRHYNKLALPVTADDGRLLGVVTIDDLIDVIEAEVTEDQQIMAGVLPSDRPYLEQSTSGLWLRRVVWLLALVIIELGAGFVLRSNVAFIEQYVTLALFITVMTATGGSCGTQSSTMVIRAMATGDVELRDFRKVLGREILVGLLLGVSAGLFVFAMSWVVQHSPFEWRVSLAVGISLSMLLIMSNLVGAFLPLLFGRLKWDPALVAGPLITTLVDVFGLLLYFWVAKVILFS